MGEVIDLPNYKTLQQRFDHALQRLREVDPVLVFSLSLTERDTLARRMAHDFLRHTHRRADDITPGLQDKAENLVKGLFGHLEQSFAAANESPRHQANLLKLQAHWNNLLPRYMEALHEDCVKPRSFRRITAYLR